MRRAWSARACCWNVWIIPDIERIVVLNRKPLGRTHPKLREIIVKDFFALEPIARELSGYNACFFCLGVSSVGISREEYRHITFDLTLNTAQVLAGLNPDMTFCYVTGAGTDSSEQGRVAWARVKGATENALLRLFKNAYMFRPGFMKASPGQKNLKGCYKYIEWLYPLGRRLYPGGFCTLRGSWAGHDQRRCQRLSQTDPGSAGHRRPGKSLATAR